MAFFQPIRYALTTLPLRRQEVHTRRRLVAPFTLARTGRRLTFQRRRDTLWAWLMVFPNCGPLPQISQTCAMTTPDLMCETSILLELTWFRQPWTGVYAHPPLNRKRSVFQIPLPNQFQDFRRFRIPERGMRHVGKDFQPLVRGSREPVKSNALP